MLHGILILQRSQDEYATGGGIKETCAIMKNGTLGNEVHRVAEVYKYIVNYHGGNFTTVDNVYQNMVDSVSDTNYSDEGGMPFTIALSNDWFVTEMFLDWALMRALF